ncbi:MAG TPA: glycosyltransferase family 39 protein, partial [Candidatus Limiplasma pullistercoris]|nr:glycosyltransferase family 39 protein [Candidatus Limiplasma pullistercoris]
MNTITDEGRLTPRRAALVLAVLLALGLALRVAAIVPYAMGPNTYSDDNGYLTSGITFARTGYIAYADPGLQTTAIGPGMPLLLGGLIALLGADPAGLVAAHIVFSCIGLLTAIAAYLLGALLCSRVAGLIAAGLCVLEPALLSVNIVFLTETPYMCLNLFAIYFLVASVREWRWGRYWAGVLCMCGAAFFKGLGLLALVAPAALLLRRRENLRPWLLRACAALAAFVLLFIPWWVRNGVLTGEFVPFTANRGDIQLMGSYIGFGYPEGTYEEAVLQSDREAW